ncbi:PD-(D/E)XK nuclease family protein [Nocardioides humi]|nr:PD-(D/E)XK nuclease family protein [Nocardioides humi]
MTTSTERTGLEPADPAERGGRVVDGVEVLGALSPSRVGDFLSCPLLFRLRTIDRLPEPPSPAAVRGTVVHRVLEQLFDLPAASRTPEQAATMIDPAWAELQEAEPALTTMFPDDGPEIAAWLLSCRETLRRYFDLEDPRRLEPAERELYVETLTDSRLLLRGVVDRVDVAPDGAIRVVDYKGLALDTPLPTPTGWTTMGEVGVGDLLIGADGRATTVVRKSEIHHRPCYRVTFADGSSVVADNVHLWRVVTTRRQETTSSVVDSDQLHTLHRNLVAEGRGRSLWIESGAALELPDQTELSISPWLLGAWLGDGHSRDGRIAVGHDDLPDMLALIKEHWPRDVAVSDDRRNHTVAPVRLGTACAFGHTEFNPPMPGHPTRRCAHEAQHATLSPTNVSLTVELRRWGLLHDKHIPTRYLRSGIEQRVALVRGLMDTDGWWNKIRRRAGFTTTSDRLARDMLELLRSLGIHPQHFVKPYENPRRAGRNWHVIEFTPYGFNPFSLPRKAASVDGAVTELQRHLSRRLVVASVQPVEPVPTQCVGVDAPDSLYLCGEGFIPTHNTGASPGEMFEGRALFQLKFYALVLWRMRGVVPKMLQLIYLGNSEVLRYEPDEHELLAVERKVQAVWDAIRQATERREFQSRPGALCQWCAHRAICPSYGGTPPPFPEREGEREGVEVVSPGATAGTTESE